MLQANQERKLQGSEVWAPHQGRVLTFVSRKARLVTKNSGSHKEQQCVDNSAHTTVGTEPDKNSVRTAVCSKLDNSA
eukprot:scaffold113366_cov27-Tisochrysis_lutea.AAC.2